MTKFAVFTLFSCSVMLGGALIGAHYQQMVTVNNMRSVVDEMDTAKALEKNPKLSNGAQGIVQKLLTLFYCLQQTYMPNDVALAQINMTDGEESSLANFISDANVPATVKSFFQGNSSNASTLSDVERRAYTTVLECFSHDADGVGDAAKNNATNNNATKPSTNTKQNAFQNLIQSSGGAAGGGMGANEGGKRGYEEGTNDDENESPTIKCSQLFASKKCIETARANGLQSSLFLAFVIHNSNIFIHTICQGDPNKEITLNAILRDCDFQYAPFAMSQYVWSKGLEFVSQFTAASGNITKQCELVEENLIKGFSKSMQSLCKNIKQLDAIICLSAGTVLAMNTNGTMIAQCPNIYKIAGKN